MTRPTHTPDPGALGDAIRRWRDTRGLTLHDLAAIVGTTPQNVSNWESGRRPRSRSQVESLDAALGAGGEIIRAYMGGSDLAERVTELERSVAALNVLSEQLGPQIVINGRQIATVWERLESLARDMQRLADPTPHPPVSPPNPS